MSLRPGRCVVDQPVGNWWERRGMFVTWPAFALLKVKRVESRTRTDCASLSIPKARARTTSRLAGRHRTDG
jgi:hypothetical protein